MPGYPEVYRPFAFRAVAYVFRRRIEGAASNSCRLRAYANSAGAPPVWMNTTASSGVKRPSRTSATSPASPFPVYTGSARTSSARASSPIAAYASTVGSP